MRSAAAFSLAAILASASCAELVQYTQDLNDPGTGRTIFVLAPANLGGTVGFVLGIPPSVVLLPFTWAYSEIRQSSGGTSVDLVSTTMFPAFVLWRAGSLLAVPFDAVEFVVYRAWRPADTLTEREKEDAEYEIDQTIWPMYPVEWVYPQPRDRSESRG